MNENNNKPVYENPWLELVRMILAFLVRMKWILVIGAGIVLAWKLGLDPLTILDWIGTVLGSIAGAG